MSGMDPKDKPDKPAKVCSIDSCGKPHYGRGWCHMHWMRWRRHGDPHHREMVPRSFEERLEMHSKPDESGCILWSGQINGWGYGSVRYKGKTTVIHRAAWLHSGRDIPPGADLDHTCRNRACLNLDHLRVATRSENNQNRSTRSPGTTTGWRNVYQNKKTGRYFCMVKSRGVTYRSDGQFSDLKSAVLAAVELRREHMPFVIEDEEAIKELMNGPQG